MENKKNQFQFHGETVVLPEIKGKKDVFISYKRKNVSFASRVFNELIKEENINLSILPETQRLKR